MRSTEIASLDFNEVQALQLSSASHEVARMGGPQAPGAAARALQWAGRIGSTLDATQAALFKRFEKGRLSALRITRMLSPINDSIPDHLPDHTSLSKATPCIYLASRNQILLALARYRAFAFDIDNEGQIVRLVGNFKGGGKIPRPDESHEDIELSSHAGLRLGPHTEAPYHCSVIACADHSPAPSALILTARWNPATEPTRIIPLCDIVEQLGSLHALALTSDSFDFTRSDCFVVGQGEAGTATSILQFDPNGGFSLRYNSYRFSLNESASEGAAQAFTAFEDLVRQAQPLSFVLQPDSALLINNSRALHCRDSILDNRRLLVRLFGYSPFAQPVVLSNDPMLVKG